jgi:DNA-binding MarR family transcriptional regulator
MRRAEQYAAEVFMRAGLPDGVTLRQTVVLAAIAEFEGRSQSELVRATGIDRSTLADMIARMEKKGLIVRITAEDDGRAKSVSLSNSGRNRLDKALPALRAADDALLTALPRNKRTSFRDTLISLAETADANSIEVEEETRRAKTAARHAAAEKARRKLKKKKVAKKKR